MLLNIVIWLGMLVCVPAAAVITIAPIAVWGNTGAGEARDIPSARATDVPTPAGPPQGSSRKS
jgi:hypothetical protein